VVVAAGLEVAVSKEADKPTGAEDAVAERDVLKLLVRVVIGTVSHCRISYGRTSSFHHHLQD
jgi:hypothetical protein